MLSSGVHPHGIDCEALRATGVFAFQTSPEIDPESISANDATKWMLSAEFCELLQQRPAV
jgi:hypothetical protein